MSTPKILSLHFDGELLTLWTEAGRVRYACPQALVESLPRQTLKKAPTGNDTHKRAAVVRCIEDFATRPDLAVPVILAAHGLNQSQWYHYTRSGSPMRGQYLEALMKRKAR